MKDAPDSTEITGKMAKYMEVSSKYSGSSVSIVIKGINEHKIDLPDDTDILESSVTIQKWEK